jgi:hypothetical protein
MKLGLPDLDQSRSAVLNSLRSSESQRGYRHSIDEFIGWYCSEPRLVLQQNRHHALPNSLVNSSDARLTLARKIAAIALIVRKKGALSFSIGAIA